MKDSRQKILDKLAKSNKRSTSVKHNVSLQKVDDLTNAQDYISEAGYIAIERVLDLSAEMEEKLGFLAGLGELAQESLQTTSEMENAIADLGIDMPEDIAYLKLRFTILKDLNIADSLNDHLQKMNVSLELFESII